MLLGIVGRYEILYKSAWMAMRALVPLIVLCGVWRLACRGATFSLLHRQQLFLLVSACALCALVEFPFGMDVYFLYCGGIVALAGLGLVAIERQHDSFALITLCSVFLLFALRLNGEFVFTMGGKFTSSQPLKVLELPRGGIEVPPKEAREYAELTSTLRSHASGVYTFCTPDCPEVYFLSSLHNPTRTLYDFLDTPDGRTTRIMNTLGAHGVSAIVLNMSHSHSGPPPPELQRLLIQRYPFAQTVGSFVVRWRE